MTPAGRRSETPRVLTPAPAKTPEADEKYKAWFERFNKRYPKAAGHYELLRQGLLDAKTKFEANKADGALKREFMVARRNLHGFWVGFRKWQIKQAKESIRRWVTDLRKHGQIMRTLAKQILK